MKQKFNPEKTVFLVDGSSFLYRAYYAIRPMHTSKGVTVQAVYGFCRMINKLMKDFSPHYFAVVWDSKGKTVRQEMYQDYKATRQAPPSDLFEQKELIHKFTEAIKLKQVAKVGVEADDLMYSLAQDFHAHTFTTVLITSDKDMLQVVSDQVYVFDPFKDIVIDKIVAQEKFGFPVEKLPFYFALIGDSSDNIPGVRGIGPKTAEELVKQFNSLEDLYTNIDRVPKERTRELLTASRDNAFLSEKLFLLRYYDLETKKDEFEFKAEQWSFARPLFEELEFKSLLKELPQGPETIQKKILSEHKKYNFKAVTTKEQLDELCALIKEKQLVALDTETNSLKALEADLVGLSLCVEHKTAYYIPVGHRDAQTKELLPTQLPKEIIISALKPILEDKNIKKYLHHTNFDALVLYGAGIDLTGVVFDTLLAASLVMQDWQSIGLKSLSEFFLQESMLSYEDVVKNNGYKNFSFVPLELATEYAAADAHQTFSLVPHLQEQLKKFDQEKLFYDIEVPLVELLFSLEKEGIILNRQTLDLLNIRVTAELEQLKSDIIALIGEHNKNINLNSPKQLQELLFVELKLNPVKKTTEKKAYSTDQEVLQELAKVHIVPRLIMKYRELFKLKSTYIDALPSYINPKTGRVHTTFSQTSAATGRLASYDPNLQNVPAGVEVRTAFEAPEKFIFLSADYSQIELRVLAYLSQDQTLIKAFLAGEDVHALTATVLFDVSLDNVTHDQRQVAKRINFSILYGLTPYGLSKDLDIPFNTAKQYIEKYLEQYPGVMAWMEKVVEETRNNGYVTTYWGRRRYLPGIYEKNRSLYELARRMAINTVAQGTAAEIMKIGMLNLSQKLNEKNLGAKILLQIHDELLLAVPEQEIVQTQKLVAETLQNVVNWNVPLVVTTRTGKNWEEVSK